MANLKRNFTTGRMNKDADATLLPQGEYRDALNVFVTDSENSDSGVVEKSLSNKRLTSLNFGANPKTVFSIPNENRDRIYTGVVSDTGSYLWEWDNNSQSATFVLQDTRALGERVFDLREDFLCTAAGVVPTNDESKELFWMTDDNMEPLCFNISRAKTFAVNGFEIEDIYLIKKPPRFEPQTTLIYTGGQENYIREEFLTFATQYKYRDGEYSALSAFTNYNFAAGGFDLDYLTLEQMGMVNDFNAVRIVFDTGDERVTDIRLVVKKSNSVIPYVVETFNKEKEGWSDNVNQAFIFSNNKTYTSLPERELYRLFDNVPSKAKAGTFIGNKLIFGNYLEGYDMLDVNGRKVKPDYTISVITNDLSGEPLDYTLSGDNTDEIGGATITVNLTGIPLLEGSKLTFNTSLKSVHTEDGDDVVSGNFTNIFDFIFNRDYTSVADLATSPEFQLFVITVMTNVFMEGYTLTPPDDSELISNTTFTVGTSGNTILITAPVFTYKIDDTPENPDDEDFSTIVYAWHFFNNTTIGFSDIAIATSCHSNRGYEVGIEYIEEFGRATPALTSKTNTAFVPAEFSVYQNKLKVTLNNPPPVFADRYRFVVKTQALSYYTIYGVLFYEEGPFRWVRLDGANKDKVNKDDILILKSDLSGARTDLFKVAVIEIKVQEKNFITTNVDPDNDEIIEEPGLYMKIKAENLNMDEDASQFFFYNKSKRSSQTIVLDEIVQYFDNDTDLWVDIPIRPGSRITLRFFCDPAGTNNDTPKVEYEETFISQGLYDNLEDWFNAEFPGLGEFSDAFTITFDRDPDNSLKIIFTTLYFSLANDIRATVRVQLTQDIVIFETEEKPAELDVYFETGQTFEIINNLHQGNLQDQTTTLPAIIELDFFNCYSMGNGAECYRVKDLINKNFLNIDLRPTTTILDEYRAIRRSSDLTYSEAYIESSGLNGLNVFNASTANYKELDKTGGSIQKLHARERDIVVLKEEEASRILFDKNAITTAIGSETLISSPGILGDENTYQGSRGIGLNPESFSFDDESRLYYLSTRKGVPVRLSLDGGTEINYGTRDYFRDLLRNRLKAKKLGGYDPYHKHYVISVEDEPVVLPQFQCGAYIIKDSQTEAFSYEFKLNNLGGDIVIQYNLTVGSADIVATFNGIDYDVDNVTGYGQIEIERESLEENIVTVLVTPVSGSISYTLTNNCPVGAELTIIQVIVNDNDDFGLTMINRFKWDMTQFYSTNDIFDDVPVSRFEVQTGVEGQNQFPLNGSIVQLQTLKDSTTSGNFSLAECNRLGYLVSSTVYNEADINALLSAATFLSVETSGEVGFSVINSGNFVFNRISPNQRLYMIYDYTNRTPVLVDDFASVGIGGTVIIDVLDNDPNLGTVTIVTQPAFGTAVVNMDNTVSYEQDGSENFEDSFTYMVTTAAGCSAMATVYVTVGIACGDSLSASGGVGIYEVIINLGTDTGYCGIEVNMQGIPDRGQLYYDDVLVYDTKYIGDSISPGPPTSYTGLLGAKTLNRYTYNGSTFDDTGDDVSFTVEQSDIADNISFPLNGNAFLVFNKTTPLPITAKLIITGAVDSTAWSVNNVICPTTEGIIDGADKFVYGLFEEVQKGNNVKSIKLFLNLAGTRFYTNIFGEFDFTIYGFSNSNSYVNDGVNWYRIDSTGLIIEQGTL